MVIELAPGTIPYRYRYRGTASSAGNCRELVRRHPDRSDVVSAAELSYPFCQRNQLGVGDRCRLIPGQVDDSTEGGGVGGPLHSARIQIEPGQVDSESGHAHHKDQR
jgi:hypothetical protein